MHSDMSCFSPPLTGGQAVLLCSILFLLASAALCLNLDGELLLQFKSSVLSDPLAALADWNTDDATPCSWNGVTCTGFPGAAATLNWSTTPGTGYGGGVETSTIISRVVGLSLPSSQLLGCVPPELGLLEHLRHLDLSGNALSGCLPTSVFNASELRVLSLADNEISGQLPELVAGHLSSLQVLNLSGNALEGVVPPNLALLPSLTVVALANNYLSGELPSGGFGGVEYLDLSSNLINGFLSSDLGGQRLRYLNLSYNRFAGDIPPELVSRILANATVDLSFNNLTGKIPQGGVFASQKPTAFAGNPDLCGKPLRSLCVVPSSLSNPPNSTTKAPLTASKSPPAFAVMPKGRDATSPATNGQGQSGLRPAVVMAIAVGDAAGIGLILAVVLYVYKQKNRKQKHTKAEVVANGVKQELPASPEAKAFGGLPCCLRKKGVEEEGEKNSPSSISSETTESEEEGLRKGGKEENGGRTTPRPQLKQQGDTLVTVDGEPKLELETLLKASAYVLGATGSSIVYKAVLANGTALAVRRIGNSSAVEKLKDFDALVRSVAKFRHPNILRLRGYYWGADEKLLIHDFAANGSLAGISSTKKLGSPPLQLSWESRLWVARGMARGLAYLHEKKVMHGNVKPSNVLLDADMEPKIADFGLDQLVSGDCGYRLSTSARLFGSKRSAQSQSSVPETSSPALAVPATTEASPRASSSWGSVAPYQAPECLRNLKPNAKWDVYSFGVMLLELLAGRAMSEVELGQWTTGFVVEERNRILRMADPAVRREVEGGREEALLSCLKLGFACCAVVPQRRPAMKEALQLLEKLLPSSVSSSSSST